MKNQIEAEIVALHQFFEDWFNARLPDTDEAFARFADALSDEFGMVTPDGNLVEYGALLTGLRSAHGKQMGIRIWIENVAVRLGQGGSWLATYEEWQETDGGRRGRLSSVLFAEDMDTPGHLRWQYVHETWLPEGE